MPHFIVDIAVPASVQKTFHYLAGEELRSLLSVGARVLVPFGTRRVTGTVVGFPGTAVKEGLKKVLEVLGDPLSPDLMKLAHWMSDYYLHPLGLSIETMVPRALGTAKVRTRRFLKLLEGDHFTGDAVCAPHTAVFADLVAAVEDFRERRARHDPLVAGKRRLLYFDNQGDGPCRQAQYADMHQFMAQQSYGSNGAAAESPGAPIGGGAILQTLVGPEDAGFNFGVPEWALYRIYQSVVVQGLLQDLLPRAAHAAATRPSMSGYWPRTAP